MIIRTATPADAGPIAALIASFQPMLTVDPSGAGAEAFLASVSESAERDYLSSPRYLFLVAERNADLAGFIALRDRTHLFHLFVARPHQRSGLARALWHAARARAMEKHVGAEVIFTVNASANAVAVYRAFGFRPDGDLVESDGIRFLPMRLAFGVAPGLEGQSP
ncbi:MAG: GNAT family N-acetyltransferase [Xanthomonadales bacterium]|nr:GNAT family N-acetyltransferase [Xanthomonadales bacterium]